MTTVCAYDPNSSSEHPLLMEFLGRVIEYILGSLSFYWGFYGSHEQWPDLHGGDWEERPAWAKYDSGEYQTDQVQKVAWASRGITQRTYCKAATWSLTSTVPSLWWISCRILWPWKPLPRPSRRATMTLCKLTSTVSHPREKWSLTAWPPRALSLFSPMENTHLIKSYNHTFKNMNKKRMQKC